MKRNNPNAVVYISILIFIWSFFLFYYLHEKRSNFQQWEYARIVFTKQCWMCRLYRGRNSHFLSVFNATTLARRGRISEDVAMLHISKWYSIASFYTKPDFTTQPQQNKCNNMQAKCRVSVILYLKQNIILILAHVRYFTWKM